MYGRNGSFLVGIKISSQLCRDLTLGDSLFKVLRGVVTSASQAFAVDNVAFGSVVYLGILIYSPTTALFSFLGAFFSTLAGNNRTVTQFFFLITIPTAFYK